MMDTTDTERSPTIRLTAAERRDAIVDAGHPRIRLGRIRWHPRSGHRPVGGCIPAVPVRVVPHEPEPVHHCCEAGIRAAVCAGRSGEAECGSGDRSPGGGIMKGRGLILVTLCLAALIINLDTTIVNV